MSNQDGLLQKILSTLDSYDIYYSQNANFLVSPLNNNSKLNDPEYKEELINSYKKRFYKNAPLLGITDYDPFYTESFFGMWEILHSFKLINYEDDNLICYIDTGKNACFGNLEATIKYNQDYTIYENTKYIRIPLSTPTPLISNKRFYNIYNYDFHIFSEKYNPQITYSMYNYYNNNRFNLVITHNQDIQSMLIGVLLNKKNGNHVYCIDDIFLISDKLGILYEIYESVTIYNPDCFHKLDTRSYIVCMGYKNNLDYEIKILDFISNKTQLEVKNKISTTHQLLNFNNKYIDFLKILNKSTNKNNNKLCLKSTIVRSHINNKINLKTPTFIKDAVTWATKYDMRIKSHYTEKSDNIFNHEYLSFIFPKFEYTDSKLVDMNNIKINGIYKFKNKNLHTIKRKLNKIKRIIDTKEQEPNHKNSTNFPKKNIIFWNKLTDDIDIYKNMKCVLETKFNVEMATNAWMKLYEILTMSDILNNAKIIKSFHMCEAPGAFISALNHYLVSKFSTVNWLWYAQTLNPFLIQKTKKSAPALLDKFGIINIYKARWLFGSDNSGDITHSAVINSYNNSPKLKQIDLITSDVGLKIPVNMYNEQERYTSHVNFSQILSILSIISVGKVAIFKTFIPLSEPITVSLLYILSCSFESITISKPLTSHPSSSEVYVICKKFKSFPKKISDRMFYLLDNFDSNNMIVPSEMIPKTFIDNLIKCSEIFTTRQIESIERSLDYRYTFYFDTELRNKFIIARKLKIADWINKMNIKKLPSHKKLLKQQFNYKK
jgi:hypothetical protein